MNWKPIAYAGVLVAIVVILVVAVVRRDTPEEEAVAPAERRARRPGVFDYEDIHPRAAEAPHDFLTGQRLEGSGWVAEATETADGGWEVTIDVEAAGAGGREVRVNVTPEQATAPMPEPQQEVTYGGDVTQWDIVDGKLEATLQDGQVRPR